MSQPLTGRLRKRGGGLGLNIPAALIEQLGWKDGDLIAIKLCGEKISAERVPLEKFGVIRNGEAQARVGA